MRLLLVMILLLGATPAFSHALGVSRATLTETGAGAYVIDIGRPLEQARRMGVLDPLLPDRCRLDAPAAGTRYRIACDPALTTDDVIVLPWVSQQGVMLTARWRDGAEARDLFVAENDAIAVDLARLRRGGGSWTAAAARYLALGVEHILTGVDHLLFVLGLLLLVRGVRRLVATITAFTIAHSITLSFATLGWVPVAARPVEAAIALSIVYLALEILREDRGETALAKRWPWSVAFVFGLLHGFGFAGALSELGLPPGDIPLALLFFNVGVEVGQLVFVAVVLAALWSLRRLPLAAQAWPRTAVAYAIGGVATYWVFSRAVPILEGAVL